MAELTDAQKVMRNDTGKSIAEAIANMCITVAGQEIEVSDTEPQSKFVDVWFQEQQQGTPVEVYTVPEIDGMRTKMESNLAYVNTGSTADKQYQPGEYLVYNGQLYKVGGTAIGQSETLNSGQGGNIEAVNVTDRIAILENKIKITDPLTVPAINAGAATIITDQSITTRVNMVQIIDKGAGKILYPANWWTDDSTGYLKVYVYNLSPTNRPEAIARFIYYLA